MRNSSAPKRWRLTAERRIMLREIHTIPSHFTAKELLSRMKRKRKKVSRATIYRALELFLQEGLIEKVELGGGNSRYECISHRPHHDHLICVNCGKIIEVQSPVLEENKTKVCQSYHFLPISHTLQILGYCQSCRQKPKIP
ncbi:transcriptional repressor [bacterium (candidate division B38) B3_B38]|nr:MAG: transcriptional repressor [bacterium (candidate division B38) B3_B38]